VAASFEVTKTSQMDMTVVSPSNRMDAGDTITYTIAVENTGQVALSDIEVSDPLLTGDLDCNSGVAGNQDTISSIAIGATANCVGTYSVTQDDVDAGTVSNTATASSGAVTGSDTEVVTFTRVAGLALTKSGVLDNTVIAPSGTTEVGDTITYTYTVTNTGNVTLTNVTVVDDKISNDADIECPTGTGTDNVIAQLLPGSNNAVECEVVYSITTIDVLGQTVTNVATVTGTAPASVTNPITTATATVAINPNLTNNTNPLEAANDDVEAPMGSVVEIEVLANDIGDNLSLVSVEDPSAGSNRVVDNMVEFTPELTFTGTVEFNYTMTDGSNTQNGKVTVTIVDNLLRPLPEIFLDINSNSARDEGEPGITGITMSTKLYARAKARVRPGTPAKVSASSIRGIYDGATGLVRTLALSETMKSTQALAEYSCATANTGSCTFGKVPAGNYRIEANFEPIKHGMRRTTESEDTTALVGTSTPQGDTMTKVAFGVTGRCTLKGFAFIDVRKNGEFNEGKDLVLRRQDLEIYWYGVDQKMRTDDDVTIVTRTDKNGNYSVENLPTGTYQVLGVDRTINCTLSQAQLNDFSITKTVRTNVPVDARYAQIPAAGTESGRNIYWAMTLLLAGAFLVATTRRRRVQ
jgi:uncharacterized repeat protein (TIGR01451 family)